jgi:ATP-dependent Clp protease ATP-binding subunit ClpC
MFERYTEAARRALFFARYAVTRHRGVEIAPEHLLLGLLRAPHVDLDWNSDVKQDTSAATILESAGVDRAMVEGRLTAIGPPVPTSVEIPFSASVKRVLQDAQREADQMSAKPITTGHLLLGLLQVEGTVPFTILYEAGVRLNDVRLRVEADVAAGLERLPPEMDDGVR